MIWVDHFLSDTKHNGLSPNLTEDRNTSSNAYSAHIPECYLGGLSQRIQGVQFNKSISKQNMNDKISKGQSSLEEVILIPR